MHADRLKNINQIYYVVEWSEQNQEFYITRLEESLEMNYHAFLNNTINDYTPLALAQSLDEAAEIAETLERNRDSHAAQIDSYNLHLALEEWKGEKSPVH